MSERSSTDKQIETSDAAHSVMTWGNQSSDGERAELFCFFDHGGDSLLSTMESTIKIFD